MKTKEEFINEIFNIIRLKPGLQQIEIYAHEKFIDYLENEPGGLISESLDFLLYNGYVYNETKYITAFPSYERDKIATTVFYPVTLRYLWKEYAVWTAKVENFEV